VREYKLGVRKTDFALSLEREATELRADMRMTLNTLDRMREDLTSGHSDEAVSMLGTIVQRLQRNAAARHSAVAVDEVRATATARQRSARGARTSASSAAHADDASVRFSSGGSSARSLHDASAAAPVVTAAEAAALDEQIELQVQMSQVKFKEQLEELDIGMQEKQTLLAELLKSQEHFNAMRVTYNQKLQEMDSSIRLMEIERERLIFATSESGSAGGAEPNDERTKEMRLRLSTVETELRTLKRKHREHTRLQRVIEENDRKIQARVEEWIDPVGAHLLMIFCACAGARVADPQDALVEDPARDAHARGGEAAAQDAAGEGAGDPLAQEGDGPAPPLGHLMMSAILRTVPSYSPTHSCTRCFATSKLGCSHAVGLWLQVKETAAVSKLTMQQTRQAAQAKRREEKLLAFQAELKDAKSK
jgi:hypothetical protein